ncbi:MAG TPA: glycosyltransferase family 1 protein [Marmoricola sp.]
MGSTARGLRVEFDGSAFVLHRRSGISRYFAELIAAYDADPRLGVEALTPYRYVTNVHVAGGVRDLRAVPLPRQLRRDVLGRLNRRASAHRTRPDVVHFPLYTPSALAEVGTAKAVTTVYDFTVEVMPELFGDTAADLRNKQIFLERCDALACISETTRADLHRLHPRLDKPVVVTPLAVSEQFHSASDRRVRGIPEPYLLHVGNRAPHKNLDLLMRAFRELMPTHPDLHLVLSGAAAPGEVEALRELGILERTRLVKVSDRDLPSLYRRAAAFVFPSRYEGFGLPALEAMAAGCPAVVSSTPALVEVTADAALVVDPDDVDGLVATLEQVLADRACADRLVRSGRERAATFSWRRTAELTATAYDLAAQA